MMANGSSDSTLLTTSLINSIRLRQYRISSAMRHGSGRIDVATEKKNDGVDPGPYGPSAQW